GRNGAFVFTKYTFLRRTRRFVKTRADSRSVRICATARSVIPTRSARSRMRRSGSFASAINTCEWLLRNVQRVRGFIELHYQSIAVAQHLIYGSGIAHPLSRV